MFIDLLYTASHSDQKIMEIVKIESRFSKQLYKIIEMFRLQKYAHKTDRFHAASFCFSPFSQLTGKFL